MPRTNHPRERNCLIIRHELIKAFATLTAQHPSRTLRNTRKLQRQTGGQVKQVLWRHPAQVTAQADPLKDSVFGDLSVVLSMPTAQVTAQAAAQVADLLQAAAQADQSSDALMSAAGLTHREHFRKQYLVPIMQGGWLVRTLDPPNHPRQRYRITDRGRAWLDRFNTLPKP